MTYPVTYPETQEVLDVLYVVAITAEAMSAALVAGRRNMDWVGVYLLGCVTALGGGSVRDILLDHLRCHGWRIPGTCW